MAASKGKMEVLEIVTLSEAQNDEGFRNKS
jgi:hypothetical protein